MLLGENLRVKWSTASSAIKRSNKVSKKAVIFNLCDDLINCMQTLREEAILSASREN